MKYFSHLYLDKEKDILVNLYIDNDDMFYEIKTPNHNTGNLITNLAKLCHLPISYDHNGLKIIKGKLFCYFNPDYHRIYIFRLKDTKIANIYPDGKIEVKALIPSIAKTLMSQTKSYQLSFKDTVVKTYIFKDTKFKTDLHTHLNANLKPDILIALGIFHQIKYPLYYIKKLKLKITSTQEEILYKEREKVALKYKDSQLKGKYLDRKIDDNVFINFADLILNNIENASYNIPIIRASLAIMKDGQAVFTNLEKVYLYRYVFAKGEKHNNEIVLNNISHIPDNDIENYLNQMLLDSKHNVYKNNTLYQNKLLWIARSYQKAGIHYVEISDTNLVKKDVAVSILKQIHEVMPEIYKETNVCIRFLAAFRRTPLTIVKDNIPLTNTIQENLRVFHSVIVDPYVAGCDIVGEEMNDIRQLKEEIKALVKIAKEDKYFVIRIHAGENDSLKDNVYNSIICVKNALDINQKMPQVRIGHGLYTANLKSKKGQLLLKEIKDHNVILEFQITSNVRLNNLSKIKSHPLKQYLKNDILCVQGTDGGAIYGTDSVDEQLAIERMLELSQEELMKMRKCEDKVIKEAKEAFDNKNKTKNIFKVIKDRYENNKHLFDYLNEVSYKIDSSQALLSKTKELPLNKKPIVICGGSYNNDMHITKLDHESCLIIDELLKLCDTHKHYFIIGNKLSGYEKYLLDHKGDFEVYSYVPSKLKEDEVLKLKQFPIFTRISIEVEPMGLYKSVAYEIFKQRESLLIAFDGNSAAMNLIQEANNSKYECRIFINNRRKMLKDKAKSLDGYITLFNDKSIMNEIVKYL